MLTTCDNHQDTIVVYDTPILASCPMCTMETELDEANDKAEDVPELKDEIEQLKANIVFKNAYVDELRTQIDELEKEQG